MTEGYNRNAPGGQKISKKKIHYPVNNDLQGYLKTYSRSLSLPVSYDDLLHFDSAMPVYDKRGIDTLWECALYGPNAIHRIHDGLKKMYSILKTSDENPIHQHLHIDRVDYCTFGNSHPFRIKIVNDFNDNYDYFYIKKADASRVYGLELEHMLSPMLLNYYVDKNTLIEEHIPGIPGDQFITSYLNNTEFNKVRIAKELVKFNHRCFVRLLGDMRSYNYVFDITPDFEEVQFRIRAIDFDQQCYEGRRNVYLPQFFKENYPLVVLVQEFLSKENIEQYQQEERALMIRRSKAAKKQLHHLLRIMSLDTLSQLDKIISLREELAEHYKVSEFRSCRSMGDIVRLSLDQLYAA